MIIPAMLRLCCKPFIKISPVKWAKNRNNILKYIGPNMILKLRKPMQNFGILADLRNMIADIKKIIAKMIKIDATIVNIIIIVFKFELG